MTLSVRILTAFAVGVLVGGLTVAFTKSRFIDRLNPPASPVDPAITRALSQLQANYDMVVRLENRVGDNTRRLQALGEHLGFPEASAEVGAGAGNVGYNDLTDKTAVSCIAKEKATRMAVILIMGQSNATNMGIGRKKADARVVNFNIADGKCYSASDPLLGATGPDPEVPNSGANFATQLGDKLVNSSVFDRVVLIPIAVGGTFISDWARNGAWHPLISTAITKAKNAGLPITHVLWHQGEGDAQVHTSATEYRSRFSSIVTAIRDEEVDAPIFVAVATHCGASDDGVRAAQKSLVDERRGIFAGPDTDVIGNGERSDGCHMNQRGTEHHAALWFDVFKDFQRTHSND